MTVLVLAREFDLTADAVVQMLVDRQVPVFRTDLADFPTRLRLDARLRLGRWSGRLWNDHHSLDIEEVRAIWNRNPSTYILPPGLSHHEREFAYREAKLALGGVLASLDVLWANHPNRCADAIWKPYQWTIANECGLSVADTEITNDPVTARRFLAGRPPEAFITKALGPSGFAEGAQVSVAYTRRLNDRDLDVLDTVALTATTLQEFVPKAFEVRLTVIGQAWFPVAIQASTSRAHTDWRSDPTALTYRFVESIPGTVVDGVTRYLKRMNLVYAGLDFVVTPEGQWVLLEANTGPEFGWLEAATGAPMTAAMADLLENGSYPW